MNIDNSKLSLALPSKIETKNQIDSALNKIECKLNNSNYEFYRTVLLHKIKASSNKEYFMKQFEVLLTRRNINATKLFSSIAGVIRLGLHKFDNSNKYCYKTTKSNVNFLKRKKPRNKYLFTPYKYFHIIYTGMTT